MAQMQKALRIIWNCLREACGENDYARYSARARALGITPLTPGMFYLTQLRHKYSRPNRCC